VLSKRKYFNPQGWETFGEALREANIPQDLIGHEDRWRYITQTNVGTALHLFQQELYFGLHCLWYAFQNFVVDQVLFHGFRTRLDWSRGPLEIHLSDQKNTEISQTTTESIPY
jgi:hypothetical protein